MHLREAIKLVGEKFLEEREGTTTGELAEHYRRACEEYPAVMAVAHHFFASDIARVQGLEPAASN